MTSGSFTMMASSGFNRRRLGDSEEEAWIPTRRASGLSPPAPPFRMLHVVFAMQGAETIEPRAPRRPPLSAT